MDVRIGAFHICVVSVLSMIDNGMRQYVSIWCEGAVCFSVAKMFHDVSLFWAPTHQRTL